MGDLGPGSSALELAAALRARELSAVELLDACLAAVDERNPELNAVIWRDDEGARAAAREADARIAAGEEAPFLGVPIPIKDLTAVAGWPVTYGSDGASDEPSEESELVVEALQRAGFVLCGRTNTPEFGPLTVAENSRYGNTVNPWDTEPRLGRLLGRRLGRGGRRRCSRSPTPTTAAARSASPPPTAAWSGSSRSRGRIPRRAQSWMGAVVEGAITRTVADAAASLDATAGPDPLAWYNAPAPAAPLRRGGRRRRSGRCASA